MLASGCWASVLAGSRGEGGKREREKERGSLTFQSLMRDLLAVVTSEVSAFERTCTPYGSRTWKNAKVGLAPVP